MKEQDKTPEGELSEIEKQSIFKVMTIKMLKGLGKRMAEQSKKLEVF